MFNFDSASLQINKDEILKYITELQILERYCSNYNGIDTSFKSEFYSDKNGSCRIIISASGIPYYKDYGNGDYFLAFDYVSRKYGSNYHETCNIIANDFGFLNNKPYEQLVEFTPTAIASNVFTYASHGFKTGQAVKFKTLGTISGDASPLAFPTSHATDVTATTTQVTFRVNAGTAGNVYPIEVKIVTSAGDTDSRHFRIICEDKQLR